MSKHRNQKKKRGEVVITKSGFRCFLEPDRLDDMRVIDLLAECQEENPIAISQLLTLLLGQKEKGRLYQHVEKNGRVPIFRILEEIEEIFLLMGAKGKNSLS